MEQPRHPLLDGFCAACKPADRRPPWQWCEEHVHVDETSPLPGRWRSDASPWVRSVMEDFANNAVRDIAVQCAARSAKTQTVMNCACWAIAEDPGPAMWVTATKDELRDFLRDRLTPTFEACRPVKERMAEPTLAGFAFDGMPFYAGWSGSKARLQSKPIRWLFCDEVRNYPPGQLEMVLKRTRSFWNSRRFLISTPGTKGDAMDAAFRAGETSAGGNSNALPVRSFSRSSSSSSSGTPTTSPNPRVNGALTRWPKRSASSAPGADIGSASNRAYTQHSPPLPVRAINIYGLLILRRGPPEARSTISTAVFAAPAGELS